MTNSDIGICILSKEMKLTQILVHSLLLFFEYIASSGIGRSAIKLIMSCFFFFVVFSFKKKIYAEHNVRIICINLLINSFVLTQ